jgi:hypothetical protein
MQLRAEPAEYPASIAGSALCIGAGFCGAQPARADNKIAVVARIDAVSEKRTRLRTL